MTTIVTRAGKGSPLTHTEVDTNFTNLNTNKLEAGAIALGSAATPSISFTGDTNTGIFSPGADQLAISTNGTSRLSIDASGNVAVDTNTLYVDAVNNRVAIGTTSPSVPFHVLTSTTNTPGLFENSGSVDSYLFIKNSAGGAYVASRTNDLSFHTAAAATERARIDSSGRLLVGTSTSRSVQDFAGNGPESLIQIEAANSNAIMSIISAGTADASRGGTLSLGRHRNATVGATPTVVQSGDLLGAICFAGGDGTDMLTKGASIACQVDGTPGADDMPGRLVFSVTADEASSPTEAVRISQNRVTQFQNDIIPGADNAYQVGQSGRRWSVVFAGTGTINTSDANLKQDIEALEQAELNVAAAIKGLVKKFRFIDAVEAKGGAARIHIGVIAQEVEQAFIDEGLDPRRYAMFCEDTVEDGNKRLGIRYDELLAFVIAAL